MKLTEAIIDDVVDECAAALLKARVSDDDALDFLDIVSGIMHDYRDVVGEDCEVAHAVGKRFGRVEFYLSVPGAWIDLFERGQGARKRSIFRKVSSFTTELGTTISYLYNGRNHVSVLAASRREGTGFLGQPMVRASIAGLVLGLACQLLPADVAAFLVDGIASPLLSLSVTILSGIMGPIIFLSLVSSIIALGDIDTLNSLGTKVFVRFLLIAALICGITLAVALAIFPVFGYAGTGLDAHAIVDLLLAIFPTNIVTPFVENNYPQLVVLGIATGSVLLVLGSQVKTLATCLDQAKAGLSELMGFVLRFAPIIPFVSIFMIAAQDRVFVLVEGWRYIAGVYACYAICLTAKLIKVSRRSRIGIPTLWRTMAPVISTAFVSGSVVIATRSSQELAEREFGVQEDFSSFWVPLSQAMLSPNSTIVFTLVPFFVASACGQTLSAPMLVALLIISIELSLATPGAVVGITTQLSALGLPADYVGLFSAYGVFIRNASSAFTVAFRMLEELDAAYALGAVDARRP